MRWDAACDAVHVDWQGWADSAEFVALNEAGLSALREHRSSRWLADCRNLKTIKLADQEWVDRDWFPRALAAGLRRMALVIANSKLAQMNIEQILSRIPGTKLDVAYFATEVMARDWLMRQPTATPVSGVPTSRT